ncbi:methyl-accepting chemotaxis protein [Microvirgula aerodenitrificans]|uniref:methyl-accepting chemotaxis protein n=1 Tax=Microvirgula aerodenitrificans TaxID=57480 RepID=UPI00248F2AEA|nr:methyl-accepting chemotaxis protein [Microvirgula aerodenitrificans]
MQVNRGLTLKKRLYAMLVCMLLGLAAYGAYSVFQLRQHILEEKKRTLHALVDSSLGVIQQQYDLFKAGKLTEAQAQHLAKDNLRKSRYNGGSDYFFIYDFNGVNLMHASKPEREGKNFMDSADPTGKQYIKEWIRLLQRDKEAYIGYMFPKKGSQTPVEKVSYARVFEPWGWWLGTGVYIEDVDSSFRQAALESLGFLLVIGLLLGIIGWSVNRSVQRQIGGEPAAAADLVEDFASGNLTRSIVSSSDLPGNLLKTLGSMQTKLGEIVRNIRSCTEQLAQQSGELSASSSGISQAARSQAESSAATAASIEELTVSINEVTAIAHATEDNSRKTVELAGKGDSVVRQVTQQIENIAASVTDSTERINSLVGRSQEVGQITLVIKEIADQTNLLALNAAIEAARAGEQGRGFAVVADEVRRLAERTTTATAEISAMIDAIQADTLSAVQSMESTMPRVRQGQELVRQATDVLEDIQVQAEDSLVKARDVASANQAQATTASGIAERMAGMASLTEQTNAAARGNAEAAEQLQALSGTLREAVNYFKV